MLNFLPVSVLTFSRVIVIKSTALGWDFLVKSASENLFLTSGFLFIGVRRAEKLLRFRPFPYMNFSARRVFAAWEFGF